VNQNMRSPTAASDAPSTFFTRAMPGPSGPSPEARCSSIAATAPSATELRVGWVLK
jgi:hypothetical protein